jgi:hypothetical protein
MINQKQKLLSIINMCNAIISNKKKDDFWVLKIKELCEREMKGGLK